MFKLGLAITAFCFALSVNAGVVSAKPSQSLSIQMDEPPDPLDWGGEVRLNQAPYVANLMEGLFRANDRTTEPAIAKKVEISKDQKKYTFTLDPHAKWSDGKPVYAQDFVYAWTRVLSPQSTSIYFPYLYDIENSEDFHLGKKTAEQLGLSTEGDFKLIVKLKKPIKDWQKITAFWPTFPVRKDQVERWGAKFIRAGVIITNGPYTLESIDNKSVVLKANRHYPKFEKLIPEIRFVLGVPQGERCAKFFDHTYQVYLFPVDCRKKSIRAPLQQIDLLISNITRYPMNDLSFRQAIFDSIDMNAAIEGLGGVAEAHSLFPKALGVASDVQPVKDLTLAKKKLQASGIKLSPKIKITLITYITEPHQTVGKRIKAQLEKNLGINVELRSLANREYTFYSGVSDYHLMLLAWTAKVMSPLDFLQPFGNGGKNRLNYQSHTYDLLVQEGLYEQAEKKLVQDDAVAKPAFFEVLDVLIDPSVKGLYFDHMGLPYFRQASLK